LFFADGWTEAAKLMRFGFAKRSWSRMDLAKTNLIPANRGRLVAARSFDEWGGGSRRDCHRVDCRARTDPDRVQGRWMIVNWSNIVVSAPFSLPAGNFFLGGGHYAAL
jgi:hypothetical protein